MSDSVRVLITGNRGFIGSALFQALRRDGHDVWGIDRTGDSACKILKADLLDAEETQQAIGSVQPFSTIIHAAALGHDQPPPAGESRFSVNLQMTENVLNATLKHQPHFLFLSSVLVYGEADRMNPVNVGDALRPSSAPGQSKVRCENMLLESSLENCHILRLAPVFNDTHMINIRKRTFLPGLPGVKLLIYPSPEHSFCHLDTVVQMIRDKLDSPSRQIINVCDPHPHGQHEISSWFPGVALPVPVFLMKPFYWSTFLLPRRFGYVLRCFWWKMFRSNVYGHSPMEIDDKYGE